MSCFDRIWETSSEIDQLLLASLRGNITSLQQVQQSAGTPELLVNPCMYPVRYNRTLSFDLNGELVPTPAPPFSEQNYTLSPTYACIPTPFLVPHDPEHKVLALSYINGIDPWKINLYRDVEELLSLSIPLFEHVLTDLHRSNLICHRIPGTCRYTSWDEPLTPQHSDDEEGWVNYQKEMREWALNRPIQYPDVPRGGYSGGLETRKFTASLRGRTVDVIIKVTNLYLVSNLVNN